MVASSRTSSGNFRVTFNQSIADYEKMYAAIFAIIVFSVLFIDVIERVEVALFRPEKRAR